ncbi:hypothetical protein Tco_0303505 [Tanacetum coccineum]
MHIRRGNTTTTGRGGGVVSLGVVALSRCGGSMGIGDGSRTITRPECFTSYMSNDGGDADQDDAKEEERALLASLIEKMKLEIDENKRMNKSLEASNTVLVTELARYKDMKCVKEAEFNCAKAYGLLEEHKIKSEKSVDAYVLKVQDFKQKLVKSGFVGFLVL